MRKQDYAALARIFREQLSYARLSSCEEARIMRNVTESLARRCAHSLSVDPAAFLTACGVKPLTACGVKP